MRVNVCGVIHDVIEKEDSFQSDCLHMGEIDYSKCEIYINKDLNAEHKKETICHEMIHAIFLHLGFKDYVSDEHLVQALGNAIYQGFEIKEYRGKEK